MSMDHNSRAPARRQHLRGTGDALPPPVVAAPPPLGATVPPPKAPPPPLRFGIVFFSNGVEPAHWWAKGAGATMELGPGALPVMPHREGMGFIKGPFHKSA